MSGHNIYEFKFNDMYKLYVAKAEKKNRKSEEVDEIICWLTGYTRLQKEMRQLANDI